MRFFIFAFIAIPFLSSGQESISNKSWQRLRPYFQTNDTTALVQIVREEKIEYADLGLLAILTCREKIFNAVVWHIKPPVLPVNMDSLDKATLLSYVILISGNKKMAEIAKAMRWTFPEESIELALRCAGRELKDLIPNELIGLSALICTPPPQTAYLALVKWLLAQGYKYDYSKLQEDLAENNSCSASILQYLVSVKTGGSADADDNNALFAAVLAKDIVKVKRLLKDGSADASYIAGNEPMLIHAIHNNDSATFRLLLDNGANANWINDNLTSSVLLSAVLKGNPAILELLAPHIQNVNLLHKNHSNVLHLLAVISKRNVGINNSCYPWREATKFDKGHPEIVAILAAMGADFNQKDVCGDVPLSLLATEGDNNWRKLAATFTENTFDQSSLTKFISAYVNNEIPDDDAILKSGLGKIINTEDIFSGLGPEAIYGTLNRHGNDTMLIKAVRYSRNIPTAAFWGRMLGNYILEGNLAMVRLMLNDIPKKIIQSPDSGSNNLDSIRKSIINEPLADLSFNTPLLLLLQKHELQNNAAFIPIIKELLSAGPDLLIRNKEKKNTFDMLIDEPDLQNRIYKYFQLAMIHDQVLNPSESDKVVTTPVTGEQLRADLAAFRTNLQWMAGKICFQCAVTGSSFHNDNTDNLIDINGYGPRNLGPWPKIGCDDFTNSYLVDRENLKFAYQIYSSKRTDYSTKDATAYNNESFGTVGFSLHAIPNLNDMKIKCSGLFNIPAGALNDSSLVDLPAVKISADYNSISVTQGMNNFIMVGNKDTILDRSNGDIKIEYITGSDDFGSTGFAIKGNLHYSALKDLMVQAGSSEAQRFKTYLEICRQLSFLNDTGISNLDKKTVYVSVHILSEYALQRGYLSSLKDDYSRINETLSRLSNAKIGLNNFYRSFTSLTKENIPVLSGEIQTLLSAPGITVQEKQRFSSYLKRLKSATSAAQRASLYADIFNEQLNKIIEDYLADYQRYTLEMIQYIKNSELKEAQKKQLLMEKPFEFREKYGSGIDSIINPFHP